jgi:hypothetical protein
MKRSSKTAPRGWCTPRSGANRVLGGVLDELTGILRAISCLASVKLGLLRVKREKKEQESGKREEKERRKEEGRGEKECRSIEYSRDGEIIERMILLNFEKIQT